MSDNRVIQSFVWHENQCFLVSTIERDSSSALSQIRYNETIVWEFDWEIYKSGKMLHMDSDIRGSITVHLGVCEELHKTGIVREKEDVA